MKKDIGKEPEMCGGLASRFLRPTCPVASDSTRQMPNPVKGCEIIKGTFSINIQDRFLHVNLF